MSVYKRTLPVKQDGKTREVFVATVGSGANRQRKQFDREREAKAWEADMLSRLNAGLTTVASAKIKVATLAKEHLAMMQKRVERGELTQTYVDGVKGLLQNYVLPTTPNLNIPPKSKLQPFAGGIGDRPVGAVTPAVVDKLKEALRDTVSAPLTRAALKAGHLMFETGRARGYVIVNPFHGFRVTGRREDDQERIVPPSISFVRAMLAHPSKHRVLLVVLATSGLRISEALALRWKHVSEDDMTLKIEARLDQRYKTETGGTKSRAGRRTIPISTEVCELLRAHRQNSSYQGKEQLVFCGPRGDYLGQARLRSRHIKPLFQTINARLPPDDRFEGRGVFHVLRHFAISVWIAEGLPLKTIQTYAGHSSVQITMDRYGHLFPSEKQHAAVGRAAKKLGL